MRVQARYDVRNKHHEHNPNKRQQVEINMANRSDDIAKIKEDMNECAVGYAALLSWAQGQVVLEVSQEQEPAEWEAPLLLFASRGRLMVYLELLSAYKEPVDNACDELYQRTERDVQGWLEDNQNSVHDMLEDAARFLDHSYRSDYLKPETEQLGWSYDDFVECRDMMEFFLIGTEDLFNLSKFKTCLAKNDQQVKQRFEKLDLKKFADEFFPGQTAWMPKRFWWHHIAEQA